MPVQLPVPDHQIMGKYGTRELVAAGSAAIAAPPRGSVPSLGLKGCTAISRRGG